MSVESAEEIPPNHAAIVWVTLPSCDKMLQEGNIVLIHGQKLADGVTLLDCLANNFQQSDRLAASICNKSKDQYKVPTHITTMVEILNSASEDAMILTEDYSSLREQQKMYHLMSIILETKECAEEVEGDDHLNQELNCFDPQGSTKRLVEYNEERLQQLLQSLKIDEWQVTRRQREEAVKILRENQQAFNLKGEPLPQTNLIKHRILTEAEKTVFEHPRFVPLAARPLVEAEITGLEQQGQIRLSTSPWNAPIVLVKCKDGRPRLCVDYRRLNRSSKFDYFPLPRIEEILYECSAASVFSTLDLRSGYHQVPMDEGSIKRTAFSTHKGHYEWLSMPFGLSGAPATFQTMSNLSSPYNIDERAAATFKIYRQVRENLEQAADGREQQRSKTAKSTELHTGQRVYVKRMKKRSDSKLTPIWRGPYRVVEKLKGHTYKLEELGSKKIIKVHLELMKIVPEASISRHLAPEARRPFRTH
ncbi:hypothetical protein C7M84_013301, partial [Penaeus vannamei]